MPPSLLAIFCFQQFMLTTPEEDRNPESLDTMRSQGVVLHATGVGPGGELVMSTSGRREEVMLMRGSRGGVLVVLGIDDLGSGVDGVWARWWIEKKHKAGLMDDRPGYFYFYVLLPIILDKFIDTLTFKTKGFEIDFRRKPVERHSVDTQMSATKNSRLLLQNSHQGTFAHLMHVSIPKNKPRQFMIVN